MSNQHKATLARVFNENRLGLIPELFSQEVGGEDTASASQVSGHGKVRALVTALRTTGTFLWS